MKHTLGGLLLLATFILPWSAVGQNSAAQSSQGSGLSARVEPLSERHLAQINRFRTPSPTASRLVSDGEPFLPLPERATDFGGLRYNVEDQTYSIEDFMGRNHVAGLLVLKDGEILLEDYGLGNTEASVWISYSMAKSVTSLLYGAAIKDGYLSDLDAKVTDYLPALEGSAYDGVSIRHLLQMASGVQWNEDYADPDSDVGNYPGGDVVQLRQFLGAKPRLAPPGERFNYNTGETDLAGVVLRAAIGNNLATYLQHKIWMPMMESPAYWSTHGYGGGERGGCCLYATLRDYGRLAQFVLNDGLLPDGTRVLPEGWIEQSITPSPANDGYGYLWWLEDGGEFRASGIYGQGIYFNPDDNLSIVVLSAWPAASGGDYGTHRNALFQAIDEFVE
ncbi:MAG: serine hydrolase domain-containing protein [Pseudohongiellaceae bacterium]